MHPMIKMIVLYFYLLYCISYTARLALYGMYSTDFRFDSPTNTSTNSIKACVHLHTTIHLQH